MKHISRLKVTANERTVGLLALGTDRKIVLELDPMWVKSGFDLSPYSMAFSVEPQLAKDRLFNGLHGVFNDSLPDGWGLLLMDRELKRRYGWNPPDITPLDRLAYIGNRAMGILEYVPEIEKEQVDDQVDFIAMAQAVPAIIEGTEQDVLKQLRLQGGSPGGARPKVTVAMSSKTDTVLSGFYDLPEGYQHWLVKFRSKDDPKDMGAIEKTYADMAILAGIDMPETKLIEMQIGKVRERFFAIRRFDRSHNEKHHVISMAGLVYADFRAPSLDYQAVIKMTQMITTNAAEVEKAFRLMLFNVLTHNKDDHAKNFSFIRRHGSWHLSPAYDLTFSEGMGNEHMTAISGSGNPDLSHVLRLAEAFRIHRADAIIAKVRGAVGTWSSLAKINKVSPSKINAIATAFQHINGGFDQDSKPDNKDDFEPPAPNMG